MIVILVVNYCYWITKNKNITIILNALDFVITLIGKYIPETKAEASKIALKEHFPFYITATIIPIEEQIIERKIIPRIIKLKLMVAINTQGFKGKTDILLYITVSFITLKTLKAKQFELLGKPKKLCRN